MPTTVYMPRVTVFGLALFLTIGPIETAGASHRQRPDLGAVRDAIGAVTDTAALRRIAYAPADAVSNDVLIERGIVALRLFRLTRRSAHALVARDFFERATERDPRDAWAWYGLGLSWADGPERTSEPPAIVTGRAFAEALGLDPASRAVRALTRALRLDSLQTTAAQALVPLAIEKRDRDALLIARASLAGAERRGEFSPDALLALAAASEALDDARGAVDAAHRAAVMTDASPVARYVYARSLFRAGRDDEGGRAWFVALENADSALLDRLHHDVEPIADDRDHDRWRRGNIHARKTLLRDFWSLRAALGGIDIERRIGDHYRRLAAATGRYPRNRKWGAPPANALLLERPDLPFDDRGLVYIRHGEPLEIIRSTNTTELSNESWVYRSPDGGFRLLHFFNYGSAVRGANVAGNPTVSPADGGSGDAYDEYLLAYNLPCDPAWAGDRHRYDRRLALLRCNEFDRRAISAEIRRDARTALRTDSDAPPFTRELPFAFDLYTFRGERGMTAVTAAIALPATSIASVTAYEGVAFEIDASLIIADTMFDRVARIDTSLRAFARRPQTADDLVRASLTMPVTPGPSQAQRIVLRESADPGHGQLFGRSIDVPDYGPNDLMISDILLAEPDSGGTFTRHGIALAPVPARRFAGSAFLAYYEIYNLTPAAPFATELVVERAGGGIGGAIRGLFGRGPLVRLRFDDTASPLDAMDTQLRRVDTSLEPGHYRIRVRVTDRSTGRSVEREREFTVVR